MEKHTKIPYHPSALTRIFSPGVYRDLSTKGYSPMLGRLLIQTGIVAQVGRNACLAEGFEYAFNILSRIGARDEYVYKSAIAQKVAMGRHSLRTATLVSEWRVGPNKADLVLLNGTATAYEVKSERDTLSRLPGQIASYSKVFASVCIVASPNHIPQILKIAPPDVGVMTLSARYTLQSVRAPENRPSRTSSADIVDVLRVSEATAVLQALGVSVPSCPNTQRRRMLRTLAEGLAPADVHAAMTEILKGSRSKADMNDYIRSLPTSLWAVALSCDVPESDCRRLKAVLQVPMAEVSNWK
ncbi:sce7726 family protein [Arsenicicoccus dermatophilus]|uniref:sce7726 family protein n=1 Tax=Arsenicicoccus dermatophilus TaxID=1076331 RepID=UPI00391744D3